MQIKSEIMLCEYCNGKGYIVKETLIDYHKSEYNIKKLKCHKCQGSGRLKVKTTIEYEPYVISELDEK